MIKKVLILFVIFVTPFSIFAQDIDVPASVGATAAASFSDGTREDIQVFIRGEVDLLITAVVVNANFSDGTSVKFLVPALATFSFVEALPHTLRDADGNLVNTVETADNTSGGFNYNPGTSGGYIYGRPSASGGGGLTCTQREGRDPDGTPYVTTSCVRNFVEIF